MLKKEEDGEERGVVSGVMTDLVSLIGSSSASAG